MKRHTVEDFIKRAKNTHGEKYCYEKVTYKNNREKVCIICPEHGEFLKSPHKHICGQGCPYCSKKKKPTTEEFVEMAIKVHGGKYTYEKAVYKNNKEKILITCPKHGDFLQVAKSHLNGCGCPKCANDKKSEENKASLEYFIKKANTIHGGKYDYSKSEYVDSDTKILITCPEHGDFMQLPNNHLSGHGCPKCSHITSSPENEIFNLVESLKPIKNDRKTLKGKELDIYMPSLRIGIEYNGLLWHSEKYKDKNYHIEKLKLCNKNGIGLIHIFEDEWINHREICISKIKQICGLDHDERIDANICTIDEICNRNDAYDFLDLNHLKGRTGFTVAIGAYNNGIIAGIMTLNKGKNKSWTVNRIATDIKHQYAGLERRMIDYFIKNHEYSEIKLFEDRRWIVNENNNAYTDIGFKPVSYIQPSYTYFNTKTSEIARYSKSVFRKDNLERKYGFKNQMTEKQMAEQLGYTRVWDCGLIKYVFAKT